MNYKALFTNIKVKLGVETNFESMNLEDGTAIEAESFAAGEAVFIVAEDGNIPLPVGTYTLEDGRSLTVEEEGIIAAVGEAEVADEEMAKDTAEYVTKADFDAAMKGISEEYVTKADFDAAMKGISEMLASKEKAKVAVKAAAETVEVKAEELSAEPVKHIKPNPERQAEQKMNIKLASRGPRTITDSVMAKIAQIK